MAVRGREPLCGPVAAQCPSDAPTTMPTTTTTTTTTTTANGTTTTVTTTVTATGVAVGFDDAAAPVTDPKCGMTEGTCLMNKLTDTPPPSFPRTFEELQEGKEWLSAALGGNIASYKCTPAAEGQTGLTIIITEIVWDPPRPDRKSSYAIKLHGMEEQLRTLIAGMGGYAKELYFYLHMAEKDFPLQVPHAAGIWTDGQSLDSFDDDFVVYFCLLMENLELQGWETYGVVEPPSTDELRQIMPDLAKLHATYWEAPILKQCPITLVKGGHVGNPMFSMLAAMLHTMIDPFKATIPEKFKVVDESYADGFPPRLQSLITTVDELAQDESAKLKLLVEKVFKIYDEERPHTLVHGDCNAGNTWKPLAGMGQTGFLFADWQLCMIGTPAWDFLTMIMTVDLAPGETETLLRQYHEQLGKASPAAQAAYSFEMLMLDFRIGLALWGGMFPIFLMFMANGAASLPAEKAKFTWEVFFPKVVDRFMLAYNEFDGAEATKSVLEDTYAKLTVSEKCD